MLPSSMLIKKGGGGGAVGVILKLDLWVGPWERNPWEVLVPEKKMNIYSAGCIPDSSDKHGSKPLTQQEIL